MAIVKRFKKNRARRNPDEPSPAPSRSSSASPIGDIFSYVGPGFAGFAATRFATRIASTQIATRWPNMAKHAGALASAASFLAAWQLAHRVKVLEKYAEPIAVGSGIAAIQSIIQLYIPRLGWVVSDATPEVDATAAAAIAAPAVDPTAPVATNGFDDNFEILDEVTGSWRAGRDAGDPGRYASPARNNRVAKQNQTINDAQAASDDPIFDMMDASDFASVGGSLAQ